MNQPQLKESSKRVHILFFVPSLGGGGAEMHFLRIINHLDRQKFQISLALARTGGAYESALDNSVKLHILNTGKLNSSTLRTIRSIIPLRKLIKTEQPDIVCSVMDHANIVAILATHALPVRPKVVVSVQIPPSIEYRKSWHIVHRFLLSLIPRLYPQADRVIALSQGVAKDLITLTSQLKNNIEVIYNAGVDSRVLDLKNQTLSQEKLPNNEPLILACGRLTEQKGFPYLIEALTYVRKVIPANLWIIGEGEQRQILEKQIQHLDLTNCVRLLGFQANPFQYMKVADVFVLSSIYEGFGNVIVEAMACAVPVVATNCPYGPAEIIKDNVNGVLVPPANSEALSHAIIRVLSNATFKQQLSQQGKKRSLDFDVSKIASAYADLFLRVFNQESQG
jgi:glycosyltransferase involved in cell wall biosynthesis